MPIYLRKPPSGWNAVNVAIDFVMQAANTGHDQGYPTYITAGLGHGTIKPPTVVPMRGSPFRDIFASK